MMWIIYATVVVLFGILKYLYWGKNENSAKIIYLAVITTMLCTMSMLRHPAVGNDTMAYILNYESVDNYSYKAYLNDFTNSLGQTTTQDNKDRGYPLFAKVCYQIFGDNFLLYHLLVAAILLIPLALFIKRYVHQFSGYVISYSFFISIFYHWLPNSATRQSIAVAFLLWGIYLWLRYRNLVAPIILILIGSTIHQSVLIGFIPMILMPVRFKWTLPYIISICLIIIFIFGEHIALSMGDIMNNDVYTDYAKSLYYEEEAKPYGFIVQMIAIFIIALFAKIRYDDLKLPYRFFTLNFMLAVMVVPVILIDPNLQRVTAYFALWGVIFIPNLVTKFSKQFQLYVYLLLILLTLGRPLLTGVGEFNFIWDQMDLDERYLED